MMHSGRLVVVLGAFVSCLEAHVFPRASSSTLNITSSTSTSIVAASSSGQGSSTSLPFINSAENRATSSSSSKSSSGSSSPLTPASATSSLLSSSSSSPTPAPGTSTTSNTGVSKSSQSGSSAPSTAVGSSNVSPPATRSSTSVSSSRISPLSSESSALPGRINTASGLNTTTSDQSSSRSPIPSSSSARINTTSSLRSSSTSSISTSSNSSLSNLASASRSVSLNSSITTTQRPGITQTGCCFVLQDTISEAWWQLTSYSTSYGVRNLTYSTFSVTVYPNATVTGTEVNHYLVNTSFLQPIASGVNPITDYVNLAPGPSQVQNMIANASAVTTGGIVVQSPQAFYVYTTVRIIIASPVTVAGGHTVCGTSSLFNPERFGTQTEVFAGINSNAEAYFGGYSIFGQSNSGTLTYTTTGIRTDTFSEGRSTMTATTTEVLTSTNYATVYVDKNGDPVAGNTFPTATVITLSTPFIYQPTRGANGASKKSPCFQGIGKENYGYVPQTLIDFLAKEPAYSAQFPGIENCLPAGPSIIPISICETPASFQPPPTFTGNPQENAPSGLTSSTTVYVTPPVPVVKTQAPPITQDPVSQPQITAPFNPVVTLDPNPPISANPIVLPSDNPGSDPSSPPVSNPVIQVQNPVVPTQPADSPQPSLGAIINSILNPQTGDSTPPAQIFTPGATPINTPIVINPTTIPVSQAPPGLVGSILTLGNTPVIVVNQPTTLPAVIAQSQPPLIIPAATTIPLNQAPPGLVGITQTIQGTPVVVVNAPTTIPAQPAAPTAVQPLVIPAATTIQLNQAPPGLQGSTTTIDGIPFLIIPGPTTLSPNPASSLVFPAATTIPLSQAPQGLQGTTVTIGETPFLIIPGPTTIPAPLPQAFPTTNIGGTPFLIIPGATSIPLSNAPHGLQGVTSTINGTPFLIIPAATNIPVPSPASPFSTTTINGTPLLVIPGPTSIPVSLAPSGLVGLTTTINNTPFLIIPSATNIPASATSAFSTTTINGTPFLIIPSATAIQLSLAPSGLSGSTSTINGTPFLVISGATTLLAPTLAPSIGSLSLVSGTTELILTGGLTTIPLNPSFSVSGRTTIISGITEVVVSGLSTTIHLSSLATSSSSGSLANSKSSLSSSLTTSQSRSSSGSSSGSSSRSSSTSSSSQAASSTKKTSTSKAGAAQTGAPGLWINALGAMAGGVVLIAL